MSILGLAGEHIYKQTGKRRTEASLLCFTWIGQLESLLKKTLANERTSGSHQDTFSIIFPTEHASILWPGLIFCRFSFALADVFKKIKLKILSFWGGEEFNINHCFLCNICLIKKTHFIEDFYRLLPSHISQKISEIQPTSSYLKISHKTSSNCITWSSILLAKPNLEEFSIN